MNPLNVSREKIFNFSEKVSEFYGYDASKNDIFSVISTLGGRVVIKGWDDVFTENDDSIIINSKRDFTIFISKLCGEQRNIFSIAHDLGHYFLHYCVPRKTGTMKMVRKGFDERVEWEANWFASRFLMPSKKFLDSYERCRGDLRFVAREFNVTNLAVQCRYEQYEFQGN